MPRSGNKNLGFTLIELLVVISIIGLLGSMITASTRSARLKAHEAQLRSDLRALQKAVELYYSENQAYPNTNLYWWAEGPTYGSHGLTGANGWIPNLAPQYVAQLPHDKYSGQNRTDFHPACVSSDVYWFYLSNGTDYKLAAYCIMEYVVTNTDAFYDPRWQGISLSVFTPGAANW